jgi:Mrp family chromosome partitioning ATPase/capsular polysaccharide biosynthesis protein
MQETSDATAIFAPLWRRKWLILGVAIVVGVGSYFYYKHATRTFSASTQVYLGTSSEEQVSGEKGQTKTSGVEVANQAAIINALVIEEVHQQLRKEGHGRLVKGAKIKAKAAEKSLFLTISAEASSAKGTILLVNRVAQAYIRRRDDGRERSINREIALTRRQLARLEATQSPVKTSSSTGSSTSKGNKGAASTTAILQATQLSAKINQLETSLALPDAQQVKPATRALLVAPAPKKDAIFGFVIGLVLASIAAYTLSRLDRRLRTLEGVESIFRSQILAALPMVGKPIVYENGQPRPSKLLLEPLRGLYTTLHLGAVGTAPVAAQPGELGAAGGVMTQSNGEDPGAARPCRILFLSADPGDGKSMLVADLALVARDSGARVAVVEANFRRPVLANRLGATGGEGHGLAEVLSGTHSIDDAIQRVSPTVAEPAGDLAAAPAVLATGLATHRSGSLFLLAGSKTVANPPALLATETMSDVLGKLAGEYDYVLVDAPSPLQFSDVMPVLRMVDGVVLVARAGHTREISAQRFMQLLAHSNAAPVIGTVANCVSKSDLARQGLSPSGGRTWLGGLIGR